MDYKIIEKHGFTTIGKSIRVSIKNGENTTRIPEFWEQSMGDGTNDQLMKLKDTSGPVGDSMLGICKDFAPDMSEFTYTIAVPTHRETASGGLDATEIPGMTWAVFEAKGALPDAIQNVWQGIMGEFFQEGKYRHAQGPDLEVYPEGDVMSRDYVCEVWVPVTSA